MSHVWKRSLALVGAIYLIAPFGRAVQVWARDTFGPQLILAVFLGGAVVVGWRLRARLWARGLTSVQRATFWGCLLWFLLLGWSLRGNPEEVFHLWEYGLLSYCFWDSLSRSNGRDSASALGAAILTACAGTGDELIQWMLPNRYFDLRDIGMNSAAGSLTAAALLLGSGSFRSRVAPDGVRTLRRIVAFALALSLLVISLTPTRIARLGRQIPALQFLSSERVIDFGSMNVLPCGVRFRSHFPRGELEAIDRARGVQANRLLLSEIPGKREQFLAQHSDITDPFVNEAEVHLFRRNFYLNEWNRDAFPMDATTVLGEQSILDQVFPTATAQTGLSAEQRSALERTAEPISGYTSPVQEALITQVSERQLLFCIGGMLLLVLASGVGARLR